MTEPTESWDDDTAILDQTSEITIPPWIDQTITSAEVDSIVQGGCDSGAYMPAVTYHEAAATMSDHGDAVLEYLEDAGMVPAIKPGESWSQYACTVLSAAVALWAAGVQDELESIKNA